MTNFYLGTTQIADSGMYHLTNEPGLQEARTDDKGPNQAYVHRVWGKIGRLSSSEENNQKVLSL